nr:ankyrin repeat domain-containing protein [Wolbachia endosymbiont of Fragariocoptes setiger]
MAVKTDRSEIVEYLVNDCRADVENQSQSGNTPLHDAIILDCSNDLIELLLKKASHYDIEGSNKCTPLHFACFKGNKVVYDKLINKGANILAKDSSNRTPLSYAAESGNDNLIYDILSKSRKKFSDDVNGRDERYHDEYMNALDRNGKSPLHYAAEKGHKSSFCILLSECLRLWDADFGYFKWTDQCIKTGYDKFNSRGYIMRTLASNNRHQDIVDIIDYASDNISNSIIGLVRRNALGKVLNYLNERIRGNRSLNSVTEPLNLVNRLDYNLQPVIYYDHSYIDEKSTVKHNSIKFSTGEEELLLKQFSDAIKNKNSRWIAEHESDLSITGNKGEILLHTAALKGYLEVVKYLTSKRADIYAKDNTGKTVMHYAARGGNIEVIKYLIDQGIEVDSRSKGRKTPLQSATSSGQLPAMRYLISQGADLNATNRDQVTTLHYAAEGSSVESIEYLLSKGFDINAATHRGITPLHYATRKGSLKVISYLVEHGADVSVKGSFGNTVLHYAAERGEVEI